MPAKRLFAAIPIHPDWLDQFGKYKFLLEKDKKFTFLRFHPLHYLHITLLFIGDVEEEDIPDVFRVLEKVAASHRPFELSLESIRYMDDARKRGETGLTKGRKKRDMVWASFRTHQAFADLVNDIKRSIAPFTTVDHLSGRQGLKLHPHTLLARFRKETERPSRLATLPQCGLEEESMPISEFYLQHSDRTQRGKKYDILGRYYLRD